MPLFRRFGNGTYTINNSKSFTSININAQTIPQAIDPLNGNESILVIQNGRYKTYPLSNLASGEPPEPIPYLYDVAPYISSGISMRQLVPQWDASFIDVYRGTEVSDYLSFPFNNNGVLDIDAVLDFAGNNSISVGYLSDQVRFFEPGVLQENIATQPYLTDGGQIPGNSKPCLYFPGGSQYKQLIGFSSITTQLPITIICVVAIPAPSTGAFVKTGSGSNGVAIGVGDGTFGSAGEFLVGLKEEKEWNPSITAIPMNTITIVEYSVSGNGLAHLFVNGVEKDLISNATGVNTPSGEYYVGGYSVGGQSRFPEFYFFENIFVDRLLTVQERSDITENMKSYYEIT